MSYGKGTMLKQQRLNGRQKAVICDLDGVLADCGNALSAMPPGNWDWFHDQCEYFQLLQNGIAPLLRLLNDGGVAVAIVTCRPERYTAVTSAWLERYIIPASELLLRPAGTQHDAWKTKAANRLREEYIIELAIDDNPDEIKRYRELFIPGLLVESGHWGPAAPQHQWTEEQRYAQ